MFNFWIFLWYFLVESDTWEFAFRKAFYEINFYKYDKLCINFFQEIFFYAFIMVIKLFFTIVYIRIITPTLIFHDHPLVEYLLFIKMIHKWICQEYFSRKVLKWPAMSHNVLRIDRIYFMRYRRTCVLNKI